jgi:hypothetical protein
MNLRQVLRESTSVILDIDLVWDYLEEAGWIESERLEKYGIIFKKVISFSNKEILLPLNSQSRDYKTRLLEFFTELSQLENKSEDEIFKALYSARAFALEKHQEIFKLRLKQDGKPHVFEFSAKRVGEILLSLQNFLDAAGQSLAGRPSEKGKIQNDILDRTQLSIVETFKGSFGITLALEAEPEQLNLIETSLSESISQYFFDLLSISKSGAKDDIKGKLKDVSRRTAGRYRKFLIALAIADSDMHLMWGSKNHSKGGFIKISKSEIFNTIELINEIEDEDPRVFSIEAKLIAGNESTQKAEFQCTTNPEEKYWAEIRIEDLLDWHQELTISKIYYVTFEERVSINIATSEEKIRYKVIRLSRQ